MRGKEARSPRDPFTCLFVACSLQADVLLARHAILPNVAEETRYEARKNAIASAERE